MINHKKIPYRKVMTGKCSQNLQFWLNFFPKFTGGIYFNFWVFANHTAVQSVGGSVGEAPWLRLLALVTCDRRQVTCNTWTWHATHDTWHMTNDTWLLSAHVKRFSVSRMLDFSFFQVKLHKVVVRWQVTFLLLSAHFETFSVSHMRISF